MPNLDFGLIGNGTIAALIDTAGEIVWCCMPRFDADPAFCSLLHVDQHPQQRGTFVIELIDQVATEQRYAESTAVLVTRLEDRQGGVVEITDFAPRFRQFGRVYCPMMLVRRVRRIAGSPRLRYRIAPACDYGAAKPQITWGSHHIRYVMPTLTLRLTTDASVTAILEGHPVYLDNEATLLLGPDESVAESISDLGRRFHEETVSYWRQWVRYLAIPFEWQDAVIRAAITLKLNSFEDTGAIIAAVTTSIPEAANSGRNWDYRYCWLRDGYFTVNALNRLGATRTMERYLRFIVNVAAGAPGGNLQPCYAISGATYLDEREIDSLVGYLGMGPVRVGNQAYAQVQHDVYGSAILAAAHVFFDQRLTHRGDVALFTRLEALGERAFQVFDQPDAGPWELRGSARVHTFSSMMCWVACDRLARIAQRLQLVERGAFWSGRADWLKKVIRERAWNDRRNSFVGSFEGASLDASLLLMHDLGFIEAEDPRFAATVKAIEAELKHGDFVYRYVDADDFGRPQNAFLVCTFWYIYAIVALGRSGEARELFERLLSCRSRHGLLAEHIDPRSGEHWGNFVQTYSMVGLINAAIRLSIRWDQAF